MSINIFIYFFLSLVSAIIFALLEIQIEGAHGWAAKLPTFRLQPWWFKYVPGMNRPLTGYHLFMWSFIFIYPHILFAFIPWSVSSELFLISYVLLITLIEDFLWFVFNPHFGLAKFSPRHIPWHTNWLGIMPVTYYIGVLIWIILLAMALGLF